MILETISNCSSEKFKKINSQLKSLFGIEISSKLSESQIEKNINLITEQIDSLKFSGHTLKESAILSKKLLMKDALVALKENLISFQEPSSATYLQVIDWLSNFIADCVELGDAFEDACSSAMREYRSSKWRFPDDKCCFDASEQARQIINLRNSSYSGMTESKDDTWGKAGIDSSGRYANKNNTAADSYLKKVGSSLSDLTLEPLDKEDDSVVTYPYGKDSLKNLPTRSKVKKTLGESLQIQDLDMDAKSQLKENYVATLRKLLENDLHQADSIVGAKGVGGDLQEMIEKIGRLQNETLPSLTDQMRDAYGADAALAFQHNTMASLQGIMDSLYSAKGLIDDSVESLALNGSPVGGTTDMDSELDIEPDLDSTEVNDEESLSDIADDFSGEEPLGRQTKESKLLSIKNKLDEAVQTLKAIKKSKK